ncbi:molybdenum cofactor sulfurase [Raphidocelis subcapitata]|uniref:Molybdenum cofactor sulfurase n=1 Tax=Raphidocelis subcapitata TaxID=307507 RepID=A0A2V0P6F4_9CHLO|nr:molybdenum cofactor sulfurase [Raphidocelis subcapitata]|eukprot:GBF95159.1 molybdenum cofactor sulfurase [Raphidocelis subcapitata]
MPAGGASTRLAQRAPRSAVAAAALLAHLLLLLLAPAGAVRTDLVGRWLAQPPAGVSEARPRALRLPPLEEAKADFVRAHPEYGYKGWLDKHWYDEVGLRMPRGGHYIDFTGSGLYTNSQLRAASQELATHLYANPHCTSPSSLLVDAELRAARDMVLAHFSADPSEYAVVFTRSATEALKIVGESFPWSAAPDWTPPRRVPAGGVNETDPPGHQTAGCGGFEQGAASERRSNFVYLRANHKSVLGVGAFARERGAGLACVDEAGMEAWLHSPPVSEVGGVDDGFATYSLAAFPAKDNYEGRLYPLDWIEKIHARSTRRHKWLVALDAAAHVPTHPLNLTEVKPDFVPISFYKMVGLPTGVGALVLKRSAAAALHIVYFGGGSVLDATAEGIWRMLMPLPEGLETGTTPFLDIIQLKHGFSILNGPMGGMHAINAHVSALREWGYAQLSQLRHSNGAPLLRIFGAHERGAHHQSGIFQFLVLRANGSAVAAPQVQDDASVASLHLRAGCDCNPGQCLFDLGILPEEERHRALSGDLDKPFITVMRPDANGTPRPVVLPTGSVRASLGSLSTFEDLYALVTFLRDTYAE